MNTGAEVLASRSQPRGRSLAFAGTFVLLAVLTACVAFIPHMEIVALSAIYLGAFLAYIGLRSDSQGGHLFEVITLLAVLSFVYFCGGTLYLKLVPEASDFPELAPFLVPALALATLGFLSMLVGYGSSFRATTPSPLGRFVPSSVFVYLLPAAAGALGLSMQQFQHETMATEQVISPGISFLQQFAPLFFFAWFLAWYMHWAKRLRPRIAVPLLVTLSAMTAVILYFTLGAKGLALTLLGTPAVAYYEVRRRVPIKSVLVLLLTFVFVIYPLYMTFRATSHSLDVTRRVDRTVEMARSWNSDRYMDASLFAFLKRMTIVTSIAAVVSDTPRWVDYRYGETLALAPIALLIPRFVWPDKPNISIGQEFGETFRLKAEMDSETYIAPSMIGDFYWNFSVPGVVVGMWLIGMGCRWYYQRYGAGAGFDPIRKSIYFTMLPTALAFEGNVAMVVGGFAKVLVILVVFLLLSRRLGWLEESSPA